MAFYRYRLNGGHPMSYPPSQPESWPGSGQQPGQWQPSYYQQPSYPAPPPPPPPRKKPVALWVGIGVLVAVILGGGAWLLIDQNKSDNPAQSGSTTSRTPTSGSSTGTKKTEPPPADGKVITSSDKRSEITVPQSWQDLPEKFRNADAVIQQGDQRQEHYVMVITDEKKDFDDFAAFERAIVANTKEGLEDVTIGDPRQLTVGELSATQYLVTGKVDGLKIVYWFTLVDGKNGYHQIVAWTLPSRQSDAEGPIFEVIESFREVGTS